MRAYELKINLKGSKPPIWRKVAVPANINFMQLHNIIQISMGWSNSHLYEFTFRGIDEIITNNLEACEEYKYYTSKEGKKRLAELGIISVAHVQKALFAKDVRIDKYLNKVTKFNYVYDFGDWWEHTVELIRVIDDYDSEYPKVLKYRQLCPPEDCGGIVGYYDFLEKYNNPDDPEHELVVEWAEEQYYGDEYDIETVNEDLEGALDDDFDFMNDMF